VTRLSKKICLLGDFAVGKTSLIRRFIYGFFEDTYVSTVGVKVSRKTIQVAPFGTRIEIALMLWELAGSDDFRRLRPTYLRGSAGAVLVCDLTRPQTLENLPQYAQDLLKINPHAFFVLVANKRDLVEQNYRLEQEVEAISVKLNAPYYLTSAKTGEAVQTFFQDLSERVAG